jgi:hypothetical protein
MNRPNLSVLLIFAALSAVSGPILAQQNPSPPATGNPGTGNPSKPGPSGPTTPPAAPAQVMQIKKQVTGDYTYRFVPNSAKAPAASPATAPIPLPAAAGADNVIALTLPAGVNGKDWQLEILDNGKGNLAHLPLSTSGVTPLTDSSFTLAQRINVPVQMKGLGVIGAQVTLTSASKKYSQTWTLQASDNGIARFDNVPLDEPITATVSYGTHPPESQTKTLTPTRTGEGWTPIPVEWADVKTVAAPPPPTPVVTSHEDSDVRSDTGRRRERGDSRDTDSNQNSANNNPLGSVINTVVSLLFLAGIGYGLYWLYTTGRMKNLIAKLGIPTDSMATAGANAPSPFDKQARSPIQPITEGTADPFGGAGMGAGAAAAPVQAGPRLVATMGTYAGSIFPIKGPTADIGRDTSNVVALPNDTNASRRHAIIQAGGGQYSVVDNGSSNGTFVNGVRIASQSPQPLNPGDEVQIGMTRFRFEA